MKEDTVRTEIRFTGRVIQVEELSVLLPDGAVARREIVRHGGGAAVVAMDPQGRIVLVRQYRIAAASEMLEIPAGKLERGEDPAACAIRELREETGFRTETVRHLTSMYPTPGYCSEVLHIYSTDCVVPGDSHPDEGEYVETVLLPLSECLAMIGDGRIRDAKTIAGILLFSRNTACTEPHHKWISRNGGGSVPNDT